MTGNTEEIFRTLARYLARALMNAENKEHLSSIFRFFPSQCCPLLIFESRLNDSKKTLDTAFCIEQEQVAFFVNFLKTSAKGSFLTKNAFWKRIEEFMERWLSGDALLQQIIENFWLEFDEEQGKKEIPVPLFFLHIKKGITEYERIIGLISSLAGSGLHDAVIDNFKRCFGALLNTMRLKYVGIFSARHENLSRVCFSDFKPADLLLFLEDIGLTRYFKNMVCYMEMMANLTDKSVLLHLDIGSQIIPKIGLEYCFNDKQGYGVGQKWQELFSLLIKKKLALPDKCDALLKWSGTSREILDKNLHDSLTTRYLDYIKVIFKPDLPL
jgi:hypothetical protein